LRSFLRFVKTFNLSVLFVSSFDSRSLTFWSIFPVVFKKRLQNAASALTDKSPFVEVAICLTLSLICGLICAEPDEGIIKPIIIAIPSMETEIFLKFFIVRLTKIINCLAIRDNQISIILYIGKNGRFGIGVIQ